MNSAKQPTTATQRAMAESTQPPRRQAARNAEDVISRAANDSSDSEDTVTDLIAAGYDAAREPTPFALDATVVWSVAGFNPRRSTAFSRAGWAPWRDEDRELPYLYENTSTSRVAVFRENMYDSMGRRIHHWCVWDGDNRGRLAAVRADRLARRVDFLAETQTSLMAEAATVDGVENHSFVLEKARTLEEEVFGDQYDDGIDYGPLREALRRETSYHISEIREACLDHVRKLWLKEPKFAPGGEFPVPLDALLLTEEGAKHLWLGRGRPARPKATSSLAIAVVRAVDMQNVPGKPTTTWQTTVPAKIEHVPSRSRCARRGEQRAMRCARPPAVDGKNKNPMAHVSYRSPECQAH